MRTLNYQKLNRSDDKITNMEIPAESEIIYTEIEYNQPGIWFLSDPSKPSDTRTFVVRRWIDDGDIGDSWRHVGSYKTDDAETVEHVFEIMV